MVRIEISDDEDGKDEKAAADTVTFSARLDRVMAGAAALAPARPDQVMTEAAVHAEDLYMPRIFAPQHNTSRQAPDFLWKKGARNCYDVGSSIEVTMYK